MDERFRATEWQVGVKELTRRLNRIRADNAPPVTCAMVNRWLLEIGALEMVQRKNGRTEKRPTEKGEAMGLSVITRRTRNGFFKMVVFNREARLLAAKRFEDPLLQNAEPEFVPQSRKTTTEDMVNAMKRTEMAIQAEMQKRRQKE